MANRSRALEQLAESAGSVPGPSDPVGQCRVALLLGDVAFEFRAPLRRGLNFAEAMRRWSSRYRVLLDREVRPDLPLLPCGRLWD